MGVLGEIGETVMSSESAYEDPSGDTGDVGDPGSDHSSSAARSWCRTGELLRSGDPNDDVVASLGSRERRRSCVGES